MSKAKISWNCRWPALVQVKNGFLQVRCARCLNCRLWRERAWVLRQLLEQSSSSHSYFVTLTYSDPNRPGILQFEHLQKFMKRLRKPLPPESVRYFCVGEYGEKHGREHWHLNIFSQEKLSFRYGRQLIEQWPLGVSFVGTLTKKSMGYVASYAQQKDPPILQASRRPGLGALGIMRLALRIGETYPSCESIPNQIRIGKSVYPMDRTMREYWGDAYMRAGGALKVEPQKKFYSRIELVCSSLPTADQQSLFQKNDLHIERVHGEDEFVGTF